MKNSIIIYYNYCAYFIVRMRLHIAPETPVHKQYFGGHCEYVLFLVEQAIRLEETRTLARDISPYATSDQNAFAYAVGRDQFLDGKRRDVKFARGS